MKIKRRSGGSFIAKESLLMKKINENQQPSHLFVHCTLLFANNVCSFGSHLARLWELAKDKANMLRLA